MGRKAAPKCSHCARNYVTEEEARLKHPECYVAKNSLCYHKLYRLRNSSKVNAKRRSYTARAKGIETVEPVLPEADRVELEIYGQENQFVHAIALKIYHSSQ